MASPGALLSVYADDRNAVAGEEEEEMGGVEGAWRAAERATALRNNEDKTQRWSVFWERGSWRVVGQPAKAL
eukprot:275672-Alexandrium_andersonii.AAC.1